MAPRKSTQSAEDSLQGELPAQAEAQSTAAAETGQQFTDRGNPAEARAAVGQDPDAAQAVLASAISAVALAQAQTTPDAKVPVVERRIATAVDVIMHDVQFFRPGDALAVTREEFLALSKAGAVLDDDWDGLDLAED